MLQEDWLMRRIRELVALVARALRMAESGSADDAKRLIDQAWSKELGMPRSMADRLDAQTLATVLGPKRVPLALELLEAEARLAEIAGDKAQAATRRQRAKALTSAATGAGSG